jgi:hypothetical protein
MMMVMYKIDHVSKIRQETIPSKIAFKNNSGMTRALLCNAHRKRVSEKPGIFI